jgi:hypothetical protein
MPHKVEMYLLDISNSIDSIADQIWFGNPPLW